MVAITLVRLSVLSVIRVVVRVCVGNYGSIPLFRALRGFTEGRGGAAEIFGTAC